MGNYRYLFGPVPSRRFGLSLGVDLLRMKTCSLNCRFCQIGVTQEYSVAQAEFAPVQDVIAELSEWSDSGISADFITLSGSGEPTLHARFGDVLKFVADEMDVPGLLLTNGTMLHLEEVRSAAVNASAVKTSLCAWDEDSFQLINRPAPGVTFDNLVEGERRFRDCFAGKLWLEVFLLEGLNSTSEQVRRIAEIARSIRPDKVHLNTVTRPPAEKDSLAVGSERMKELCGLFDPPGEVIGEFSVSHASGLETGVGAVLSILRRRPCTAEQVAEASGQDIVSVEESIESLLRAGKVAADKRPDGTYYTGCAGR